MLNCFLVLILKKENYIDEE